MKNGATKRPSNHGRQRSTGGNSVYAAVAGEVVNRRSVLLRNFVLNGQESAFNPRLHIHAKRYRQEPQRNTLTVNIKNWFCEI